MKFKKSKPIECTREEFELVKGICDKSSCSESAVSIVRTYLIKGLIKWNTETRTITTTQVQDMAYNTVKAVMNNYKYLTISELPAEPGG